MKRSAHAYAIAYLFLALPLRGVLAAQVIVLNRAGVAVELQKPSKVLQPGGTWVGSRKDRAFGRGVTLTLVQPNTIVGLPDDRYAIVVVGPSAMGEEGPVPNVTVHDTNGLQVELSAAAHGCQHGEPGWDRCMAGRTFGGFPEKAVANAFKDLWGTHRFWHTCSVLEPAPPLRSFTSKGGFKVDILREEPMIAAVRGFVAPEVCKNIMANGNINDLVRAHTGVGGGGTATSDSRETLTTNLFVNWGVVNGLSVTAARSFDLVSELYGQNFSYEGQEPINFLHYLRGYEYKPHMDGSANGKGKRVATTLMYCVAADVGGSTVFTEGEPIRFQPGAGDVLYFAYNVKAHLTTHAACPVVAGLKSTLTQWYRPDVSPTENWDSFENWGKFDNPHQFSWWTGDRHGAGDHHFEL